MNNSSYGLCPNCGNQLRQGANFCPNCGRSLTAPTPVQNAELKVDIGRIETTYGALSISVTVKSNGAEQMNIYAYDPSNMRKSGTVIWLDPNQMMQLKHIFQSAENTLMEMRQRRTGGTGLERR